MTHFLCKLGDQLNMGGVLIGKGLTVKLGEPWANRLAPSLILWFSVSSLIVSPLSHAKVSPHQNLNVCIPGTGKFVKENCAWSKEEML